MSSMAAISSCRYLPLLSPHASVIAPNMYLSTEIVLRCQVSHGQMLPFELLRGESIPDLRAHLRDQRTVS